jgi:hypothetical protein
MTDHKTGTGDEWLAARTFAEAGAPVVAKPPLPRLVTLSRRATPSIAEPAGGGDHDSLCVRG